MLKKIIVILITVANDRGSWHQYSWSDLLVPEFISDSIVQFKSGTCYDDVETNLKLLNPRIADFLKFLSGSSPKTQINLDTAFHKCREHIIEAAVKGIHFASQQADSLELFKILVNKGEAHKEASEAVDQCSKDERVQVREKAKELGKLLRIPEKPFSSKILDWFFNQ
jgi:hypothetical protein